MADPNEILTPQRFDVPAKTLYGYFRERCLRSDWGEYVYAHHLKVWNGFHEGEPKKDGFSEYKSAFDAILDDMKNGSFSFSQSPLKVNEEGHVLNGGHRLSAALLYSNQVETEVLPKKRGRYGSVCPYQNLLNHSEIVPTGLEREVADAMAMEYCRLRKEQRDVYVVTVFPSAVGQEEKVQELLSEVSSIVYRKEAWFTENGSIHLIYQLYRDEAWVGSVERGLKGARRKAAPCFARPGAARVFLVQCDDPNELAPMKERIRKLFQIGKDSVHINDTYEETLHLARLLFNENSIHFLNNATLRPQLKKYWSYHERCRETMQRLELDCEEFCIDASGPLGAYGMRDVSDLDYLHSNEFPHLALDKEITSHMQWAHHYPMHPDSILFDPRNHFYFDGMKFATLSVIREMKIGRWEQKDQHDVQMINAFELSCYQEPPKPLPLPPLSRAAKRLKKLIKRLKLRKS